MIATRFDRLLKEHGYKCREHTDYQGTCVYEKQHIYNKMVCTVTKDSHGKAQEMTFASYNTLRTPKNMEEFKTAEFDRGYLVKEARMIHEMFEALKTKKGIKKVEISFTNFH
jgi:hypothetical protein